MKQIQNIQKDKSNFMLNYILLCRASQQIVGIPMVINSAPSSPICSVIQTRQISYKDF